MALQEEKRNEIIRELANFERYYELLTSRNASLKKLLMQNEQYERFSYETGIGKSCLAKMEEVFETINSLAKMTDRLLLDTRIFLRQDSEVANSEKQE